MTLFDDESYSSYSSNQLAKEIPKTILLIDYSMLVYRALFVARIQGDKPQQYKGLFFHHVLNLLQQTMTKYKVQAKDVYICKDSKFNWRKEVYKDYKANRKKNRNEDDFDWNEFFEIKKELDIILDTETKLKNIEVHGAEADDILYVLAKEFNSYNIDTKIVVITSDKDLKQVIRHGAVYYDPMKKIEIKDFNEASMMNHILIGDKADNIPSIKEETEFTLEFLTFLKNNSIFIEDVKEVQNLEVFESILEKFKNTKDYTDNKVQVYKKARFGEKTAQKAIKNGIDDFLNENELYKEHFERNKILIDMDYIPKDIQESILEKFNTEKNNDTKISMFGLQDFMVKYKLKAVQKVIFKFLT